MPPTPGARGKLGVTLLDFDAASVGMGMTGGFFGGVENSGHCGVEFVAGGGSVA